MKKIKTQKNIFITIGIILIILITTLVICYDNIVYNHTVKNIKKVEEYASQIVQNNTGKNTGFSWNGGKPENNWTYYNGFLMYALLQTGKYNDFVNNFYNNNIDENGHINKSINPYNKYRHKELDSIAPAVTLFYLPQNPKYDAAIKNIYTNLSKQPILEQCGENYKHKVYNKHWRKYQFALDGLYMVQQFNAEYALKTENKQIFDDIATHMDWTAQNMKNDKGLYNHGATKNGLWVNGVVWLRAVGWYAMAQVDIIEYMPETEKEIMKSQLTEFFDNMLKYQNKNTGLWNNVVYPTRYVKCNKPETSGSAMMSYALLKAYNKGYVDDIKYAKAGLKAFNGISDFKLKQTKTGLKLSDIYYSSSVKDTPEEYCDCSKYVNDDAKGAAPLILSALYAQKVLDSINKN